MAWVNICSKTYDSNYNTGKVKVVVQYDDSSITTTSITCRTKGYLTGYNGSCEDTYFIYSNGGGISRICYRGGTSTKKDGSSYYTSNSFTLSKTSTTSYFTLPELRLCNDGSHHEPSSKYTDSNGRGWSIYWKNSRHMWTTVNSGGSTISTDVYVHSVSKPSAPSAPTNNHNNTFSASCSAVSNPGYNPVTTTIQYKLGDNGSWVNAGSAGTRVISRKVHSAEPAADSQTVYVRVKAQPTYGSDSDKNGIADPVYSDSSAGTILKNYVAPSQPTEAPSVSKTKSRFTVKEPWTVSWSKTTQQAQKKNNSSPVAGYRIIMLVKRGGTGGWISEPFRVKATNSQGWKYLGQNPDKKGNNDTWYTVDTSDLSSKTSITIDPMLQGFVPGDKIKIGIRPYILWNAEKPPHEDSFTEVYKLFSCEQTINGTKGVDSETYTFTDEITVQNAGVVRVKTGTDKSSFKEGIVWVKINNTGTKTTDWVEADVVKVKTSRGWKESE